MKRNQWIKGATILLAGIGLYKIIHAKRNENPPHSKVKSVHEQWTTAEMPDLTGRVIVVTGANSGIGFEAAKAFARKGARTILACRNVEKAQQALTDIQTAVPHASAEIMRLDLADLASVRHFAQAFRQKYSRLDVLVKNAGIMMVPYSTTKDGFESHFGVNHLGHFALTGLLFDLLAHTPGSRVVTVSSAGHRLGTMDFDNLMYARGEGYSPAAAYGRSKLANLLFTKELQRRFDALGTGGLALAAHPGSTDTNLGRHVEGRLFYKVLRPLLDGMIQSAAMGALPILRAAVDPDAEGGGYYGPNGFLQQRGYPVAVLPNAAAQNLADAQRLWHISQQLTGVTYG